MKKVVKTESLKDFFSNQIDESLKECSIDVLRETREYLVDLLDEFTRAKRAFLMEEENPEEPLSIRYLKALHKSTGEKVREYRMIGDFCLFVSGFFSDFIQKKIVDLDFYISIGSSAYSSVESTLKNLAAIEEDNFTRMFRELSEKFPNLVEVYMDVSERLMARSARDLLRIYEKYLVLRSKRYEKILREAGIEPIIVRRSRH